MKNTSRALMICAGLVCSLQMGFFGTECLAAPPPVPTNVQASDGTNIYKEVRVTWYSYGGPTFSVWRNTSADTSTAVQVGTADAYTALFIDTNNVVRGVVYYYWVRSIISQWPYIESEVSDFSAPDTGYAVIPAPTGVQASDGMTVYDRDVDITWDYYYSEETLTYSVWRNTSADTSTATQVGETAITSGYTSSFTDSNAVRGVVYYYWVRRIYDGVASDFSAPDTGYAKALAAPEGVQASDGTTVYDRDVDITWNYVCGVSNSVWRNTSADTSTATQVTTDLQNNSFTDSNVVRGVVYYYWVQGFVDDEASDFSAPDTGYAMALPVPTEVQASDGSTKNVIVTWKYPDGRNGIVTNYSVWRSPSNSTATAELIGSTAYGDGGGGNVYNTNPIYSFTNVNVAAGAVYYYWVRAEDDCGGVSGFSAPDTGKTRFLSVVNDFDGDGLSDVVVYRDGFWSIYSMAGYIICNNAGVWGGEGYIPVPGDYDGDGNFDAAVAKGMFSSGRWSIYSVTKGIILNQYDDSEISIASMGAYVPGDYDGDGKYELAVCQCETNSYLNTLILNWYINFTNHSAAVTDWGTGYDLPAPGDYDGDGKYDYAVYREGYWSIYSLASEIICNNAGPWGGEDWIPAPGDYDGDGQTDLAVYRDGFWSIYSLANGIICNNVGPWGGADWIPVPGDYDGDGQTDLAVYRDGFWSIYSLANGIICNNAGVWGGIGYIPLGTGLRQFSCMDLLADINAVKKASGWAAAAHFIAKTVRIGDMLQTDNYGVRTVIDIEIYDGTVGQYIKGDGYAKPGARYIYMIYGPTSGTIMFIAYFSLY